VAARDRQLISALQTLVMTMTSLRRFLKKSRGSAAIEFALVMPLMLMLLAAVIDWGHYMSTRVSIARAAMDGARAGAAALNDPATPVNEITQSAQTRTQTVLQGMGKACGSGCMITATACATGQGTSDCGAPPIPTVVVTVTYPYSPFFGFVPTPTNFREQFMMVQQGGAN
jgi:Flp pilus assembly protein TadG